MTDCFVPHSSTPRWKRWSPSPWRRRRGELWRGR